MRNKGRAMDPRRSAVPVRGNKLASCTVGSMVFIHTTEGLYISHVWWVPLIDEDDTLIIREAYSSGRLSTGELATIYEVSQHTILATLKGLVRNRKRLRGSSLS